MLPALAILLLLEGLFPHRNITQAATLNFPLMALILGGAFAIGRPIATRIKAKLGHDLAVEINGTVVTVWLDREEVFSEVPQGVVIDEKAQLFRMKIYGNEQDVVLYGREQRNPFGFCSEKDLMVLRACAVALQEVSR